MTEKKDKAESSVKAGVEAKPKVARKPAPPKAEAKAAAPAKATKPAAAKSGKTITVQQVGSPIGRQGYQRSTLIGLGLNKMNRTRTLEDSPSVRGMIESVKHLVKVVE